MTYLDVEEPLVLRADVFRSTICNKFKVYVFCGVEVQVVDGFGVTSGL